MDLLGSSLDYFAPGILAFFSFALTVTVWKGSRKRKVAAASVLFLGVVAAISQVYDTYELKQDRLSVERSFRSAQADRNEIIASQRIVIDQQAEHAQDQRFLLVAAQLQSTQQSDTIDGLRQSIDNLEALNAELLDRNISLGEILSQTQETAERIEQEDARRERDEWFRRCGSMLINPIDTPGC